MRGSQRLRQATLATVCDRYLLELQLRNRSPRTVEVARYQFARFSNWCEQRGVTLVSELTSDIFHAYRRHLFHYRTPFNKPLCAATQAQHLVKLRTLSRFVTHSGHDLGREYLAQMVRRYLLSAEIGKVGGLHLLRHTAATLMMENGADLRSLQTYLGHARLDTTQRYTHLTLDRLKDVHSKTHPTRDDRLKDRTDAPKPPAD